jgi:hypothetical protein
MHLSIRLSPLLLLPEKPPHGDGEDWKVGENLEQYRRGL